MNMTKRYSLYKAHSILFGSNMQINGLRHLNLPALPFAIPPATTTLGDSTIDLFGDEICLYRDYMLKYLNFQCCS